MARAFPSHLKEAKRLNLQISLTIQSGWNVGGPTVTGAQGAKLLTWTRKVVHGPLAGPLQIDVPPMKNGFYKDIAVMAYPLKHGGTMPGEDGRKPIRDLKVKAVFVEAGISVPDTKPLLKDFPAVAGEEDLEASAEVDLTKVKMSVDGKLGASWSGMCRRATGRFCGSGIRALTRVCRRAAESGRGW